MWDRIKLFDRFTHNSNCRKYVKFSKYASIYVFGLFLSILLALFITPDLNIESSLQNSLINTLIQCQFTLIAILFSAIIILHQLALERYSNYISDFYRKSPQLWILVIFYLGSIIFKIYFLIFGMNSNKIFISIVCFDSLLLINMLGFFNNALSLMTPSGTLKKLSQEMTIDQIVKPEYYKIFTDTITSSLIKNEFDVARDWIIEYNKLFQKYVKSTSKWSITNYNIANSFGDNLIEILIIVEQVQYPSLLIKICYGLSDLRSLDRNFHNLFITVLEKSCNICLNLKQYDKLSHLSNILKNYALNFVVPEKDINELNDILSIFDTIYYSEIEINKKTKSFPLKFKLDLTDIIYRCRLINEFDEAVNRTINLQIDMLKCYIKEKNWLDALALLFDIYNLQQGRISKSNDQTYILEEFASIISNLCENYNSMLYCVNNNKEAFQKAENKLNYDTFFSVFSITIRDYVNMSISLQCSEHYIKLLSEIAFSKSIFMASEVEEEFDFISNPEYKQFYKNCLCRLKDKRKNI